MGITYAPDKPYISRGLRKQNAGRHYTLLSPGAIAVFKEQGGFWGILSIKNNKTKCERVSVKEKCGIRHFSLDQYARFEKVVGDVIQRLLSTSTLEFSCLHNFVGKHLHKSFKWFLVLEQAF
jgi:hypothetical protein